MNRFPLKVKCFNLEQKHDQAVIQHLKLCQSIRSHVLNKWKCQSWTESRLHRELVSSLQHAREIVYMPAIRDESEEDRYSKRERSETST